MTKFGIITVLALFAATPALAAETGAKANSNTTMKGDHDKMGASMQGSMSGTMMMSADHAKMMSDKQKKAKAKAMSDSAADTPPGGTMMMSGKDKH